IGFADGTFMLDHPFETDAGSDGYDAILFHAETLGDLGGLERIEPAVGPKTMLWIVYPKGRRDIKESDVFAHGKAIGLVDVKVCKFSEKETALKFVRRKS
ncbi:MAG TPA: hypothetical protein VG820_08890, partial [Fimbriimonadaceae bacterium]|nr:hypothetical protein [Fimbriimonadaceae bacterium]